MLQRQGPGFDSERAIVQLTTTSGPKARFGGFDILIFIEIVRFIIENHAFREVSAVEYWIWRAHRRRIHAPQRIKGLRFRVIL